MRIVPALAISLFCVTSHAAPVNLICQGVVSHYPNGFGSSYTTANFSRVFTIDVASATVRADTLFGTKTTTLASWSSDRYFGFEIPLDHEFAGRRLVNETVSINRFTGVVEAYYKVQPDNPGSVGFGSFSGQCTKAEPRF
jgi:hypothetical protein